METLSAEGSHEQEQSASDAWTSCADLVALFAISLPSAAVTAAIHRARQPATQTVEAGKYKLYVFEVPAGEETYEILRQNESLLLTSTFEYSDRGTVVALKTSLRTRSDLTPERFAIKGKTSIGSDVDLSVDVTQRTAQITDRARARQATVPDRFFVNSGAFPISATAMLFRSWIARNIKTALRTIPDGAVTIEHRGI